ncbi:50S ribosomal protein L1 [archaeon]|nr:50S ribosomal protein L1 [archaeon]
MPLSKEEVLKGLKKLRELSPKRNFTQTIDLQISLRDFDPKKNENKLKEVVILPHGRGKKASVAAFVDKELVGEARKIYDEVILKDDFKKYAKKRAAKNLVRRHKFFVAQANLMGEVAKSFGRYLGPKGRMPDPKAGAVIPPKKDLLKPLYDKLQKIVRVRVRDQPNINLMVGVESMTDEQLADNVMAVYKVVRSRLPRGEDQIGGVYIKMTMSRSVAL